LSNSNTKKTPAKSSFFPAKPVKRAGSQVHEDSVKKQRVPLTASHSASAQLTTMQAGAKKIWDTIEPVPNHSIGETVHDVRQVPQLTQSKKRVLPPSFNAMHGEPQSSANGVQLSTEQQKVLQLVKSGDNIFFTGSAGTGKTFRILN
jgi:phosphate starvation-inducible protein PhoH